MGYLSAALPRVLFVLLHGLFTCLSYVYCVLGTPLGKSLIRNATETKWPCHSMYYVLLAYILAKNASLAFIKAYLPFFIDAKGI